MSSSKFTAEDKAIAEKLAVSVKEKLPAVERENEKFGMKERP